MQEAGLVYGLDTAQYLRAEPQHGAGAEAAAALTPSQLGQIATLDRHHHVVEALVATAADEAAHVLAARHHCKCGNQKYTNTPNRGSISLHAWQSKYIRTRYHSSKLLCVCVSKYTSTRKHSRRPYLKAQ